MPVRIISATGAAALQNLAAIADPSVNDDLTLGYSAGSTWRNTITSIVFQCIDASIGAALWVEIYNPAYTSKINSTAVVDPTVNDDSTQGYSLRSWWLNNVSQEAFICLSAAPGAAHWEKSTLTLDELGSMATQSASSVAITGGTVSGVASSPASEIMPVNIVVSANGTTNLNAAKSDNLYLLTGTLAQTFKFPTTPAVGTRFRVKNLSSGALTIQGDTAAELASDAMKDGITNSNDYGYALDSTAQNSGVRLQFSSAQELTGWSLFYNHNLDGNGTLSVQYSDDGLSWTTAATWSNFYATKNDWNSVTWASVGSHVHWRLILTSASGYSGYFTEMKVTTPTGDIEEGALPEFTTAGTGFAPIGGTGDLLDSASSMTLNTGDAFEFEYVSAHLWAVTDMGFKVVPVANGGTGAITAALARTALDVYSKAESAALEGLIPESAGAPSATPAAGTIQAYRDTSDGNILKYKTSAATIQKFDSIVGTAASAAALESEFPAASHAGRWAVVTGTGTESGLYQVVTGAWALRISANVYSKSEVDGLDEWEVVASKLRPKDAYAGDTMRIGTSTTGYPVSGDGAVAGKFTSRATADVLAGGYMSGDTTPSPLVASADTVYAAGGPHYAFRAFDNNAATSWIATSDQGAHWLALDFTVETPIVAYSIGGETIDGAEYSPKRFKLQGWNGSSYVDLESEHTDQNFGAGTSPIYTLTSPGAYTKYRLYITERQVLPTANDYVGVGALTLYKPDATTAYVYSGSAIDFAPGTLVLTADGVEVNDGSGKVQIAYSKNGAAYTAYENIEDFRASASITGVTDLKIKVKHLTAITINSLEMSTPGSELLLAPSGLVQIKIDGTVVWEANSQGDTTSVDSVVQSLTSTGPVEGTLVKATTALQVSEQGSDPASATGVGQLYTKSDNTLYFRDGDGNVRTIPAADQARNSVTESRHYLQTANDTWTTIATIAVAADEVVKIHANIAGIKNDGAAVAGYGITVLASRVGSNAPVILGTVADTDIESTTTGNYTSASAWDKQADISSNNVVIQVRGGASDTVKWQAIVERHSLTKTTSA